ncbi:DUF559 domain-containing protein, partial [Candidatus Dependentiae bacterium]|nr:DUF559 domain-containing protein [Candidatus Dependentiae bacterium]
SPSGRRIKDEGCGSTEKEGYGCTKNLPSPPGRRIKEEGYGSTEEEGYGCTKNLPSPSGRRIKGEGCGSTYRGGFYFSGLVEKARELRKKQTSAEAILWTLLRNRKFLNLKFRRQHQIGDYIVDFYCDELKLIIELDGEIHNEKKQKKKDQKRDKYLKSLGYNVLRFKNKQIFNNIQKVFETISKRYFINIPSPPGKMIKDEGEQRRVRTRDTVLFIDAREIYKQVDRAHREFTPEHIEFISNIVRMYRGEPIEKFQGQSLQKQHFPKGKYKDIPGLCKITTLDEIREQGYSLNPGRYVGIPESEEDDYDFKEKITELHDELKKLNKEAHKLEKKIDNDIKELIKNE